ncbi:MAG: glycosyltransferase [Pseudanabaenaceae cyanobacterium]
MRAENPVASVIIPTYNGGELFRKTLQALANQKWDRPFEVVVIDSGSRDHTLEILADFGLEPLQIPNSEFNHGATRDRAAAAAKGEFLVFINQDAMPENEHWLAGMIAPFADPEVLAVQGGIRERDDIQRFFWDSCGERFYFTSEAKNWIARYHNMGFSTVGCAIRRSVWEQHPFGTIDIMEDKHFQRQVHHRGPEIVYSPATVLHTHDYTFAQLRRRCLDEGYGWRLVGERYTFGDCVRDMLRGSNYRELWRGWRAGQIRRWSEVVFPLLRPWWVYKGNRFQKGLTRS